MKKPTARCYAIMMPVLAAVWLVPAAAAEDDPGADPGEPQPSGIYRSPEERREAGLGTRVTEWLKISALLELEQSYQQNHYTPSYTSDEYDALVTTFQLAFDLTLGERLESEVVFEAEHDEEDTVELDEGLVAVDWETWELQLGRINVPFGEYYSHFVTRPALEFGETRRDTLLLAYSPVDAVEVAGYMFDGRVKSVGEDNAYDWGISLELTTEDEGLRLGAGYLSDLAESEEDLLEALAIPYRRKVSAWSVYALLGLDGFEVTAEAVAALDAFQEGEPALDQPRSYNLELAYYPSQTMQWALRYETSRDVEDAPHWQSGLSVTRVWRERYGLSLDYLYGKFKKGGATDDEDRALASRHLMAARVFIAF